MSVPLSSSSYIMSSHFKQTRNSSSFHQKISPFSFLSFSESFLRHKLANPKRATVIKSVSKVANEPVFVDHSLGFDLDDSVETEDEGSPWEGAIVYKRNSSISHFEYCTTLERLGLGNLSTDVSKAKASNMGIRITKAVDDYPSGTPVQISIDVTRKIKKLRLDGIIKTVLTLGCNRCGEAAAESIFSNFTLILSEDPVEEPDVITFASSGSDQEQDIDDDEDALVDLDDWLYFPREEKEIDISKHIRDMVHVEITIAAVCDPNCKGMCLKCGVNLNKERCECNKSKKDATGYGPLANLKDAL